MTSRVLSTFFFVSLVSLVAAVIPSHYQSLQQVANRTEDVQFSVLNPASPSSRQKRQTSSSTSTLKWVTVHSGSSLPSGAVSIYNSYAKRNEYVCKCGCRAGFLLKGSTCRYPGTAKIFTCSQFEILVNKDNFEYLDWQSSTYGKVPQNSIRTCSDHDIYVAKNSYGLGLVQVSYKNFFCPYWSTLYKYTSYQVLTYDNKISRERLSDVKYNIKAAKITRYRPNLMFKSSVDNDQRGTIMKQITFSKKYKEKKRWALSIPITAGVRASITAGIPFFSAAGIKVSAVTRRRFSKGSTMVMLKTISREEEVPVPEDKTCIVSLWGHRYKIRVPFTARLSRIYSSGAIRRTTVSGVYSGFNIAGFTSVINRCDPSWRSP